MTTSDRPFWMEVRCPWCMDLLGYRIAGRTVSGVGLIRSHAPHCGNQPRLVLS